MPTLRLRYEYRFHAVGQGLFSSGRLSWMHNEFRKINEGHPFRWVFDCGQHPGVRNVTREVREYRIYEKLLRARDRRLHLLCISHFDEDHINGFRHLLQNVEVVNVVLPYYPLIDRLVLLLGRDDQPTPDEIRYSIDPVRCLVADVRRSPPKTITLIKGGSQETVEGEFSESFSQQDESKELTADIGGEPLTRQERVEYNGTQANIATPSTRVLVLDHSQPVRVNEFWEFMFYTEYFQDIPKNVLGRLRKEVNVLIRKRFKNLMIDDADAFIRELQGIYDKHLGRTAKARNRISLWMYAGPVGNWRSWFRSEEFDLSYRSVTRHGWGPYIETPPDVCGQRWHSKQRGAIMYTGDCDVSDSLRYQAALQHFQQRRIGRVGLLQMPHHGASGNWHPGNGAAWPNLHAVISAARVNNHGHPGQSVLNDLTTHGHCVLRTHESQRVFARGGAAWTFP